jgi:hypothetical protein
MQGSQGVALAESCVERALGEDRIDGCLVECVVADDLAETERSAVEGVVAGTVGCGADGAGFSRDGWACPELRKRARRPAFSKVSAAARSLLVAQLHQDPDQQLVEADDTADRVVRMDTARHN